MQVDQMKREREDKNKIIANLMTQIKVHPPSFSFVFFFFSSFSIFLFKINYLHKFIKGLTPEASKSKYLFTSANLAPLFFLFLFFLFCLFLIFFSSCHKPQPTYQAQALDSYAPIRAKQEEERGSKIRFRDRINVRHRGDAEVEGLRGYLGGN